MKPIRKAYLQLHISVFLWGFTAILGKLISLHELPLVWYRVIFTCLALLFLPGVIGNVRKTPGKQVVKLAGIGCLVCIHWVCFYGSIKYSNVTVSLSCLATTSFMVSLLEPLILRRRLKLYELSLGLLIIPGVYMIFYFTSFYTTGIILGLLSALLAAVFTILNKTFVDAHEPRSMTFIELGSGMVFLSMLMPLYFYLFPGADRVPLGNDWAYLVLLAVGCTTLPFVLALRALRQLTAFASTLTVNLEPVYGIIMAIFFFQENKQLDLRFYFGTCIILLAVFIHPMLRSRFDKEEIPIH